MQPGATNRVTTFQQIALLIVLVWLVLVLVFFRRSRLVLVGGLLGIGLFTLAGFAFGVVTPEQLGLSIPTSWLLTIGLALVWLGLMIAYSPLADKLASRWFVQPPTLEAFGTLQQSMGKLIAGIAVAWVLGAMLEELVTRGIVQNSIMTWLSLRLNGTIAAILAVFIAALGACMMHLYQGARAAFIISQLSVLFGILFVFSGYNLWVVMLCHGLYDTIAFIRFASKKSKYSRLPGDEGIT
jgi:membrane protease YdiL (CAAX protease family)